MLRFGYESYLTYAYPKDELCPLTCTGRDTWGSYALTLVDTLDTLVIVGNHSEFKRAVNLVRAALEDYPHPIDLTKPLLPLSTHPVSLPLALTALPR